MTAGGMASGAKLAMLDALDRLRQAASNDAFGRLSTRIDGDTELGPLRVEVARLAGRDSSLKAVSHSLIEEARRKWTNSKDGLDPLTSRDIRALCADPEISTQPAFVRALQRNGKLASNRQWLERLIQSYFAKWGAISSQEQFEGVLRNAVWAFAGKSPDIVRCMTHRESIFSPDSPTWLAKQALSRRLAPDAVILEWKIPAAGRLARAVCNASVDEWTKAFTRERDRGQAEIADCHYLLNDLLGSALLEPASIGRALSEVILWDVTSANEEFREQLEQFLLDDARFGDPRLPANAGNWSAFSQTAKARVIAWLAKRDLLFFFNLVIDSDPHHRRDFWLNYIDQVEDSNVALCHEDEMKLLRATRKEDRGRYARIIGAEGVSAFLMRFRGAKGLVFVEFSETNNALFVHDREKFDAHIRNGIRAESFRIIGDLKRSTAIARISHMANWRDKVRIFLAQHGIRRG